ncbi:MULTISPECIES: hypothetical protein [unclassified Pseudoalteromonas]|uniref:hypothetical protein n=1 Tax=unclassified Pseudoalteromonas TaxID=194690 RepID=UPI002872B321|nr:MULTISPECIES: hypothetical protein [unclassified Pseudoalteromonas]
MKVGSVGCTLGIIIAYNLFFVIASSLGIEADVPIRSYSGGLMSAAFALCILALAVSLYIFCLVSGAIYYGFKLKKELISKDEFMNIVFKGVYPTRWQKRL